MTDRGGGSPHPPTIGVTLGDPRGIGPEVARRAVEARLTEARWVWLGPEEFAPPEGPAIRHESIGRFRVGDENEAGRLSALALERGIQLATTGEIGGLVTAPLSKAALHAAGWSFPGHTEFLRDRTGVDEVTMMFDAESTRLGGSLRLALLTAHIPLRDVSETLTIDLVARRTRIAIGALRSWWGLPAPRVAFAGVNPHAGEGGLLGDEEGRVFRPVVEELVGEGVDVVGILPGDTVFGRALEEDIDLVVTPYHDVGLAVLKTIARDTGVNVTAGLPFPRTSPDHGTAFDIAGRGLADAGAMTAAVDLCIRFAKRNAS